jgi:DNA-binding NarL/FixJ family response regulator
VIEMLPVDDRTEVSGMASRELVFPKSQMPPAPAREPVPAPLPGDVRPLLLVVDDEPALRRSIERSLRARWRVITTATTQDAFKICEEEPVDVILCDLTLSEDDGLNLLRLFHSHTPHLLERTVLMSGEPSERQIELARRNRPYLVLKPFDLDVLEEQLRAALAGDRVALWVPPVSGSTPRPAEPRAVG